MNINNKNNEQKKGNQGPQIPKFNFNNRITLFLILGVAVFILMFSLLNDNSFSEEKSYSWFKSLVKQGDVVYVEIVDDKYIVFEDVEGNRYSTTISYWDETLIPLLDEKVNKHMGKKSSSSPFSIILQLLPWGIMIFFLWFMFRQIQGTGSKALSFGKSKAKRYLDNEEKITFSDVAGQEEAKYELEEVVEFLKNPQKFAKSRKTSLQTISSVEQMPSISILGNIYPSNAISSPVAK